MYGGDGTVPCSQIFDPACALDGHFRTLTHRAQKRMGVSATAARTGWGLEAGGLRMTHGAAAASLLRYGLVIRGSCMPPDFTVKIDTHLTNVLGLTRIEMLHFLASAMDFKNMYIIHCAVPMASALRAPRSTIAVRTGRGLAAVMGADTVDIERAETAPLQGGRNSSTPPSAWEATGWYIIRRRGRPQWAGALDLLSKDARNAPEIGKSSYQRSCVSLCGDCALAGTRAPRPEAHWMVPGKCASWKKKMR